MDQKKRQITVSDLVIQQPIYHDDIREIWWEIQVPSEGLRWRVSFCQVELDDTTPNHLHWAWGEKIKEVLAIMNEELRTQDEIQEAENDCRKGQNK